MPDSEYNGIDIHIEGSPVPDITGIYTWTGTTNPNGGPYDYWQSASTGYTAWHSAANGFNVIADTFPAEPTGADNWWRAYRGSPVGCFYPQGTADGMIHTYPILEAFTPWHQWGQFQEWLVRSDATKTLTGQAMYPRTAVPPKYSDAPYPEQPNPYATLRTPDSQGCQYDPQAYELTFWEYFNVPQPPDTRTGISLFQINPRSTERAWEVKHTRLMAAHSPWPENFSCQSLKCTPQWEPKPAQQIRYLARIWNELYFRHVGPTWSTAAP